MGGQGILHGIYAKYYGVDLVTLAGVLLMVRMFDAVTDPLAGYFSDILKKRTGSRKLLICIGGVSLVLVGYFLYAPLSVSYWYLVTFFLLFNFAKTLFDPPYLAWGSDLAPKASDKSKIFAMKVGGGYVGWVMFYAIPLLPFFATTEVTPLTLKVAAVLAAAIMIGGLVISFIYVPDAQSPPTKYAAEKTGWREFARLVKSVIANTPLLLVFSATTLLGFAIGAWSAMHFLLVDTYLGLGDLFAAIYVQVVLIAILTTPAWSWLAIKFGTRSILAISAAMLAIGYGYSVIPTPETASFVQLFVLKLLPVLGVTGVMTLLPASMSQIVDYTEQRHKTQYAGSYFALYALCEKITYALGSAIALAWAGSMGFDATAASQTASGVMGLKLVGGWVPGLSALACAALILANPITDRRHGIVRRRLDRLAARSVENGADSKNDKNRKSESR